MKQFERYNSVGATLLTSQSILLIYDSLNVFVTEHVVTNMLLDQNISTLKKEILSFVMIMHVYVCVYVSVLDL